MLVPRRHFLKQTPSRLVGVSQHYKQYDPRVVVVWLIGKNGRRCLLCGCIFLFSEAVSSKFEVGLDKGGHRVTKSCHCKGPVTLTSCFMKRSLSPAVVPLAKAHHTAHSNHASVHLPVIFDQVFVDELVLVIFSFLSASDLCGAQAVNRNWSRLALDNQVRQ